MLDNGALINSENDEFENAFFVALEHNMGKGKSHIISHISYTFLLKAPNLMKNVRYNVRFTPTQGHSAEFLQFEKHIGKEFA